MRQVFGTDYITGLDVSKASHKIDPSSLTVSDNGWTDEEGVWRVAPGPTTLYTGYSNIKAMSAGRMGGADHVVWLDGSTLYDNGSNVGTLATDSDAVIHDFNDQFLILGATDGKNYIWDGNVLREQGAWQPDYSKSASTYLSILPNSVSHSITAISAGATTEVTIGAHTITADQYVYISGISGMTELNGHRYKVASATATTIVLSVNSSAFSSYTSGGTVYLGGCGLTGDYKYYVTCVIRIEGSGRIVEGKPRGMRQRATSGTTDEAEVVTLAATDKLYPYVLEYINYGGSDLFSISGTAGTDWTPGFRVYRTKAGGTDYYLEFEYWMGAGVTDYTTYFTLGLSSYIDPFLADDELGSVYTPGATDRSSAPESSVMTLASQRLWMNDEANPERLYYTSLDGIEYVPTLNFLTFPDTITAVGSAGDVVAVFSGDRMWRVTILGGIPDVDEIKTPVGTTYGDALTLTDLGLLFLRDDGLWTTDGASPPSIVTRRAFSSLTSPQGVAAYGDTLILCGSERAYVMRRRDGGIYWHEHGATYTMVDATNGTFYAADANSVYSLFTGTRGAGALESPTIIVPQNAVKKSMRVVLDVDGDSTPTVLVNGNVYSDYDSHSDIGTGRRIARLSIPRLLNHAFTVRVELSGDAGLYGYWMECE